ncbi:MAG: PIN domain-containing protein [Thermoleophilia bacterium]|nr:PIN domain-containing protein [Thermoleophilia bacterium]
MTVFIDTSAIYALFDAGDDNNGRAARIWERLISEQGNLVSTNYVMTEIFTLLHRRLGLVAVRMFQEDVYPLISVQWIDENTHHAGVAALLAAGRKKLSLVDCVSFDVMRSLGIKTTFCFDRHFKEQGFDCL